MSNFEWSAHEDILSKYNGELKTVFTCSQNKNVTYNVSYWSEGFGEAIWTDKTWPQCQALLKGLTDVGPAKFYEEHADEHNN